MLGLATRGPRAIAVGGQGRDLFLASDDGVAFRVGHSPNGGLRSAWLEPDGGIWVVGEYGYAARSSDGGATSGDAALTIPADASTTGFFGWESV